MSKSAEALINRRTALKGSALTLAASTPSLAASSPRNSKKTRAPDDLTAEEVRSLLNLEPNATCGYVRVTI